LFRFAHIPVATAWSGKYSQVGTCLSAAALKTPVKGQVCTQSPPAGAAEADGTTVSYTQLAAQAGNPRAPRAAGAAGAAGRVGSRHGHGTGAGAREVAHRQAIVDQCQ